MDHPPTPQARYAALAREFTGESDVVLSDRKGFGSSALCIGGKIFATLVRDRLLVKLPRQRVDDLVASGDGERLETGDGRAMKEWLSLDPASSVEWLPLAREALAFVGAQKAKR
jgi:TfoX/Sxy family transcriptional regulator of competence genes